MFIVFIKPYAKSVSAQIGILHYKYTKKMKFTHKQGEKLEVRN